MPPGAPLARAAKGARQAKRQHNEYHVLLYSLPFHSFLVVLTFVVQSDEPPQPPKSVPLTPFPTNVSSADQFQIFKTHATMQTINAHLVPFWIHCLDCLCCILDTVCLVWCREHQLPAQHHKPSQHHGRKRDRCRTSPPDDFLCSLYCHLVCVLRSQ